MEGGSFEEKVSVVLNNLAGFSDFCTELHTVSHCPVQYCKVSEFIIKFVIYYRSLDKITFIDLCNNYPEAFKTMFDWSLRKKKIPRLFFNAVRKMECVERAVEIG